MKLPYWSSSSRWNLGMTCLFSVSLSNFLSVQCLSVCLYVCLSVLMTDRLSVCPSIHPSICLSVICLSVCLYVSQENVLHNSLSVTQLQQDNNHRGHMDHILWLYLILAVNWQSRLYTGVGPSEGHCYDWDLFLKVPT